jgi:mycobactin peptide synthetase MbtE
MYRSDVELFIKHFSSDCVLIHSYASSETGFICSYYVDQSTKVTGHRVPVGYPEKGKELSIIDDQGDKLSIDQPGEIVVTSRFISSGYWQRDDESKVNFQSSIAHPESKIYHTGDIGQLSAVGLLTHLGRKDDRVKIRNFRVDIGEVEATLAEHPEVKLASVIAKEESSGDTRLIAYFVPRNKLGPSVRELREYLGARLPHYMVPSVFIALAELPLTGTGKVNRRALPDPGKSRPNLATPLVAPNGS